MIEWPGLTRTKPDGSKWSAKLKLVVIEEKPFIFKLLKPKNQECNLVYKNSIECPWSYSKFQIKYFNNILTKVIDNFFVDNQSVDFCCYGYCIDLIRILSQKLSIEYELYLVPDGLYGDYVKSTFFSALNLIALLIS